MVTLYYAKANDTAKWARVAGPFETSEEAWGAVERLRPMYPGYNITVETRNVSNAKAPAILGGPRIEERTTPIERTNA